MVDIPDECRFTNDHEWARVKGDVIVIGITDYAQDALGEIVYIELPGVDEKVSKGDVLGAVESTKAVSDLFSPLGGEVVEVNKVLLESPEIINSDPYGEGWMFKIAPSEVEELEELMSAEEYSEYLESEMEG
ncbi:MAG: glycine cleavage system protein GcvH [Candidatus Dadabacteria bacterium]|nr:glycine cleavage system protein GcvH [Candidatus Dadabacteria bacterium]